MLIILLITAFYYGEPHGGRAPDTQAVIAPSKEECLAAAPKIKAKIEEDKSVRVARVVCLGIETEGNKA